MCSREITDWSFPKFLNMVSGQVKFVVQSFNPRTREAGAKRSLWAQVYTASSRLVRAIERNPGERARKRDRDRERIIIPQWNSRGWKFSSGILLGTESTLSPLERSDGCSRSTELQRKPLSHGRLHNETGRCFLKCSRDMPPSASSQKVPCMKLVSR